jgi:predicted nucleic acid-binding protein
MPKFILIDAGPLIALFDRDDKYHEKTKRFITLNKYQFISATAILTEVENVFNGTL